MWFPTERSKAEKQRPTLRKSRREKKMVGKVETMLERQRREEEKRNQKKEAGYPNLSTPWKTSPHPNLALESTLYLKVCVFIKEAASLVSWQVFPWMRRWGVAGAPWAHLFMWQKHVQSDILGVAVDFFFFFPGTTHDFHCTSSSVSTHLFVCGSCTVPKRHPHNTYWPP